LGYGRPMPNCQPWGDQQDVRPLFYRRGGCYAGSKVQTSGPRQGSGEQELALEVLCPFAVLACHYPGLQAQSEVFFADDLVRLAIPGLTRAGVAWQWRASTSLLAPLWKQPILQCRPSCKEWVHRFRQERKDPPASLTLQPSLFCPELRT
jgi:hypothetical protein